MYKNLAELSYSVPRFRLPGGRHQSGNSRGRWCRPQCWWRWLWEIWQTSVSFTAAFIPSAHFSNLCMSKTQSLLDLVFLWIMQFKNKFYKKKQCWPMIVGNMVLMDKSGYFNLVNSGVLCFHHDPWLCEGTVRLTWFRVPRMSPGRTRSGGLYAAQYSVPPTRRPSRGSQIQVTPDNIAYCNKQSIP